MTIDYSQSGESVVVSKRPAVYPWFVAYCVFMAFLYSSVLLLGIFVLLSPDLSKTPEQMESQTITSIVMIVLGSILVFPFAIAPFLQRKPWVWIYGIVLIAIGMTSCWCMPVVIPLLVYWLKPETKIYFGRI